MFPAGGCQAAPTSDRPTAPHARRGPPSPALWLVGAACLAASGAAQEEVDFAAEIWRPRADAAVCAGAYVAGHANQDATAGSVRLRQGDRWLATHAAEVNQEGVALVDGALDYGERGLRLRAAGAQVALQSGDVSAHDVDWVLTTLSLRGHAAQVHKQGDQLRFTDAALTRCSPDATVWRVRARDLAFDAEKSVVTARHVRVHVAAAPVFYVPYMRFAVDAKRASGFLFPEIRYQRDSGLDIALPYYANLAPNYDATLAVRHMRAHGTGLEGEFRHLGRHTRSNLHMALLPSDRDYNGSFARTDYLAQGGDPAAFASAKRWMWSVRHRGRRGGWTTGADFAAVSDDDYFQDMDSTLESKSQVALRQRATLRYQRGGLQARLAAEGVQRLEPGIAPYRRLPEARLFYNGSLGTADWTADGSWTRFRLPGGTGGEQGAEGSRLHLEPRLRLPLVRDWGFLALTAGSRHTRYTLENNAGADTEPTRDIHLASIDGSLVFERDLRGGRWLQTLEPRLRYFHQSHADQDHLPVFDAAPLAISYDQLFHDNRFAGLDRIGEANEVAFGIRSQLRDRRGRELLTARFGALTRLRDPKVVLPNEEPPPKSAFAADLATEFGSMRLRTTIAWDAERTELGEAGIALAYRKDETRLVNVGYRRRADVGVEQTDVSFHWPVTPRWRLFGRWNHDWRFGQMVEGFAGFRYANCCLEVKLLGHKTIQAVPASLATAGAVAPRADRGVLVEIVLRGLGGVGGGVDSRLGRAIKGFGPSRAF